MSETKGVDSATGAIKDKKKSEVCTQPVFPCLVAEMVF